MASRSKPAAPKAAPKAAPLAIRYAPTEDLQGYERNARTHSGDQIAQIARSIEQFGFVNPILLDRTGTVIAGHGRLAAAKLLGRLQVPVIDLPDLTAEQARALVIADNKLALNAGWDETLLASELAALGDLAAFTGFSAAELDAFLNPPPVGLTDPDAAPEAPAVPVSVPGDHWLLGRHHLVCGDCTVAADVAEALAGSKPHLMVTDPPYGVNYDAEWRARAGVNALVGPAHGKVTNDDRADWREAWALFPGSVAYVWHGGLAAATVAKSLEDCRLLLRAQIVWVKPRQVIGRGHYHWQHEPCAYAVTDGADDQWRFVPEHEIAAYAVSKGETADWHGDRKQSTVWFIEHVRSETGHSTQKPVECMKRPIENNSEPGDAVYEPFVGSGTTLIAAEMTGRICHALEVAPAYVDVAVERWQAFVGKDATCSRTGKTFSELKRERLGEGVA